MYSVYYGQEGCGRIVSTSVIWSGLVLKVASKTGKETGRSCWDTTSLKIQARDNGDQTGAMRVGLGRKARSPSTIRAGGGAGGAEAKAGFTCGSVAAGQDKGGERGKQRLWELQAAFQCSVWKWKAR